jgi:hypothetical protein
MLTTLAFLAALPLAPAQQGELSLTHPQLRYGLHGPVRTDGKVLPGDNLTLQFDIENVTNKDGKARYSTALEVIDPKGKAVFKQAPREQDVFLTLGGNSLPASATVALGLEQPAGEYTIKVDVTDLEAKKTATLSQKFTVLPRGFGFVGLSASSDPDGRCPCGPPHVGQAIYLNAAVIGFERAGPAKQPNLVFEMRILDEQGKPTLPRPFTAVVDDKAAKEHYVDERAVVVPAQFLVALNRAGKFTVELKATDKIGKKDVVLQIPIVVQPAR